MRTLMPGLMIVAASVFVAIARSEDQPASIDTWVSKLGSTKFKEREAATAALDKHAEAALPALRAALKSTDPEVRRRVQLLIQRIEHRVESVRVLAGSTLRLNYKDAAVLDAVKDFATKARMTIWIGDDAEWRSRRITLDTGETTVWDALDQICQKAGLSASPYDGIESTPARINISSTISPAPIYGPRVVLKRADGSSVSSTSVGGVRMWGVLSGGTAKKDFKLSAAKPDKIGFLLEVTPELGMGWQNLVSLRLTHAVDDKDQVLKQPEPYLLERVPDPLLGGDGIGIWTDDTSLGLPDMTEYRHLVARLTPGKLETSFLKHVRGVMTAQVLSKQSLVNVGNLMSSMGQEHAGPGESSSRCRMCNDMRNMFL